MVRWSHDQAFQLFLDNTALSEAFITSEVRRYITWPGQVTMRFPSSFVQVQSDILCL